jgi:hypothetical protein
VLIVNIIDYMSGFIVVVVVSTNQYNSIYLLALLSVGFVNEP